MRPCFLNAISANSTPFPFFDGDEFAVAQTRARGQIEPLLPSPSDSGYNRQNLPEVTPPPLADETPDAVEDGRNLEMTETAMKPARTNAIEPQSPPIVPVVDAGQRIETRAERLARIRREIELGIYDTPERFAVACERMFDKLTAGA